MDLGDWLRSLGLERYEAAFRKNEINDAILPTVTAEDLKISPSNRRACPSISHRHER